jgi:hypothetical protein
MSPATFSAHLAAPQTMHFMNKKLQPLLIAVLVQYWNIGAVFETTRFKNFDVRGILYPY